MMLDYVSPFRPSAKEPTTTDWVPRCLRCLRSKRLDASERAFYIFLRYMHTLPKSPLYTLYTVKPCFIHST